jgi:hypothetical protein
MHKEETSIHSPENEPGHPCANVDPHFPERTVLHLISQSEFNYLVRGLSVSKIHAELLAFRLWWENFLQEDFKLSFRKRHQPLSPFFPWTANYSTVNMQKDFCNRWVVHTVLKNGEIRRFDSVLFILVGVAPCNAVELSCPLFKLMQQFAPFHHSAQYEIPGCKQLRLSLQDWCQ